VKDIIFHDRYFTLQIAKSKTDQYREGSQVLIHRSDRVTCPYLALKKYLSLTGISIAMTDPAAFIFRPCFKSGYGHKLIYKNKSLSYTRARQVILDRLNLRSLLIHPN
jgi:hypothetical protein